MTENEIRQLVYDAVEQALHPGVADPTAYLQVTVTDPISGHIYRGHLYLVVPHPLTESCVDDESN